MPQSTRIFSYSTLSQKLIVACAVLMTSSVANASLWSWLGFSTEQNTAQTTQNPTYQNPVYQAPVYQGTTYQNPTYYDSHAGHDHNVSVYERAVGTQADYQLWLSSTYQRQLAYDYENYLRSHLGNGTPPMYELLTTARSWQECGFEPYQVPPVELWSYMLPTLRLYDELKYQGILPRDTVIRSVYRSPELNRCAGGAAGSKHMTNAAIDIWVPRFGNEGYELYQMKDKLCQFWKDKGQVYNFGLGLYATGAIHIDTQGYRKWGAQYSNINSPCRDEMINTDGEALYIDGQF